ncbi:hypothetical protein M2142_001757 [Fusobacterium sp. PH5-29]
MQNFNRKWVRYRISIKIFIIAEKHKSTSIGASLNFGFRSTQLINSINITQQKMTTALEINFKM